MLATIVGIVVSKDTMTLSYVAQFSVLLAIMTNICQYFLHVGFDKPSHMTHFQRFGSYYIMCLASVLIMVAPLKSLSVDLAMTSFKANGYNKSVERTLTLFYRPELNEVMLQIYTAAAYVLMTWVMCRQLNVWDRLKCWYYSVDLEDPEKTPLLGSEKNAKQEDCRLSVS